MKNDTQPHPSSYQGKKYKDILKAARELTEGVFHKADVNAPNNIETYRYNEKINVIFFSIGVLVGAVFLGVFIAIEIFGSDPVLNTLCVIPVIIGILRFLTIWLSKLFEILLNKIGLKGRAHFFLKWLFVGGLVLGAAYAIWFFHLGISQLLFITALYQITLTLWYMFRVKLQGMNRVDGILELMEFGSSMLFFFLPLIIVVLIFLLQKYLHI